MNRAKKFVFLAHYVESWNWLLNFRWFRDLHKHPEHAGRWMFLAPLYKLVSFFYLIGQKSYNVVDEFAFGNLEGATYLIRDFGWHFFVKNTSGKIKKRILKAVLAAQEAGANVVGLGALTKDEMLTRGGRWIVDKLGDELKIPLVHGDTLTAATVVRQIERARARHDVPRRMFITGATSKIGRAVCLKLAEAGYEIRMFTNGRKRFLAIQAEAGEFGKNLIQAKSLEEGSDCQVWVTGKMKPSGKELLRYIPQGALVLNFSVPNPFEFDGSSRDDLVMEEAGMLAYDPEKTDLRFTMRLRPGLTYACHAGTMCHAHMGWTHHEVDQVDVSKMDEVWEAAQELGFFLLPIAERVAVQQEERVSFFKKVPVLRLFL
jgi:predicted amino acid dehydrogenase